VANQAFRERRIVFTDIVPTVEGVLEEVENVRVDTLDEVWSHDRQSRRLAEDLIAKKSSCL
jgi:1-deoxy-D-xylulose 5-phosphate reductoisomerase